MKSWPILPAVVLLALTTSTLGNFDADTLDKDENQINPRSVDEDQDQDHGEVLYASKHKRRSTVNLMRRAKRSTLTSFVNLLGSVGLRVLSKNKVGGKDITKEKEDELVKKIKKYKHPQHIHDDVNDSDIDVDPAADLDLDPVFGLDVDPVNRDLGFDAVDI